MLRRSDWFCGDAFQRTVQCCGWFANISQLAWIVWIGRRRRGGQTVGRKILLSSYCWGVNRVADFRYAFKPKVAQVSLAVGVLDISLRNGGSKLLTWHANRPARDRVLSNNMSCTSNSQKLTTWKIILSILCLSCCGGPLAKTNAQSVGQIWMSSQHNALAKLSMPTFKVIHQICSETTFVCHLHTHKKPPLIHEDFNFQTHSQSQNS